MNLEIKGIYPAIVTPFDTNGQVSEKMLGDLVEYHIASEVDGFYVCGGTGEGLLLSVEERKAVVRKVVEQTDGRAKVMAHVGAMSTHDAVTLAKEAAAVGADSLSALPPLFYKVGPRAIVDYYRAIAEATNLPVIGYYIPALTGLAHSLDEISELLCIKNMVGLKFSDSNLFLMQQIIERHPEVVIMSGNDEIFLPALIMGCNGSIGLTLNFMPNLYVGLYNAYINGDYKLARDLQYQANRIIPIVIQAGQISAVISVMDMIGYPCGNPRLPLPTLSRDAYNKLKDKLNKKGLFSSQSVLRNSQMK
jgi:N-acetylneuraminate lyase